MVKSHTKNMVPVSIIRHGEERTKRRGGGGGLIQESDVKVDAMVQSHETCAI